MEIRGSGVRQPTSTLLSVAQNPSDNSKTEATAKSANVFREVLRFNPPHQLPLL